MSQITVRQAVLADAASITEVYKATTGAWARQGIDGSVIPADYDDLTLFERWQAGGPQTSIEMCAVHLANLLRGADGIPLVAEIEGQIGAEAEIFIGNEPEPFGHHVNVSRLRVRPEASDIGLGSALLAYIQQIAEAIRCKRVTVADAGDDAALYEHHRFQRAHTGQRITFPAQEGRVFYRATELTAFDPAQIAGWHMPLGRYQNAREEWDRLPPGFWNSVPEVVELDSARVHITLTGQEAYAFFQQDRADPERVQVFMWTKRPINNLLMVALRDWAARHNYHTLVTFVWDYVLPLLEIDYTPDGYTQHLYARSL
ncbi:MAG TPA: GNAT family N-acetyltransferase [Aggregatilinea sp.]|jgi:GNAT superfamily N-acetyltransferase|uniref:GNAT family N-acetyltransferase n=1 Tax=Aggregatilinea sp. TaxID=2806333 RepID=UPI002C25BDA1|nr:GNAT family N-acetyltransferase [Aggregatilinea sp.]HML24262.1 GNAT family N-acetyltransferase [Aggregatilinea sp.]